MRNFVCTQLKAPLCPKHRVIIVQKKELSSIFLHKITIRFIHLSKRIVMTPEVLKGDTGYILMAVANTILIKNNLLYRMLYIYTFIYIHNKYKIK